MFWPLHGPAGFLPGHGSCFRHSPFLGYSHEAIPQRLARPVVLPQVSPPGPSCGAGPLSGTGHRNQPGEIQPRAFSGCSVSRGGDRHPVFCGFSFAGSHRQATVNSWRISVLRRSSCQYLALAARHAVLSVPSRSVWSLQLCSHQSWDRVAQSTRIPWSQAAPGSEVVAALAPPLTGGVSPSSVYRPGLLVRLLGRRLGGSPGSYHRFRPLESRGKSAFHQRKGTSGCVQRSLPLPVISSGEDSLCLLRQQHSRCLPPQGGRQEVSLSEFSGSGDSPLVGVPLRSPGSPVHPGVSECSSGHSVPPSPAASYRVVPQSGGLSVFTSSVAGPNRLVCYLRESPMLDLFLSLPGSSSSGYGRIPPVLERSSGLRVSSVVHHSQGSGEAQGISGNRAHLGGSVLAPTDLVSRPPPPVAGSSYSSAGKTGPPALASLSQPLSGSPQASPSCLETLRRFMRAAGFSSTVASQASLARRPLSRQAYQLKWQVYRSWCHSHGHSVSRPSLAKVTDFLCWLRSSKGLSVSSIKGYRSMLSAVFRFHILRSLWEYIKRASKFVNRPRKLFVSPHCPSRAMSKNGISFSFARGDCSVRCQFRGGSRL